jgi:hypothetical protein
VARELERLARAISRGSGCKPIFLPDPSVPPRDISGHRPDTRAEIVLSRGITRSARGAPRLLNQELPPPACGDKSSPPDDRGRARRPICLMGGGPPAIRPGRADPRLSREGSSAQSTAPHDDASVELHESRSPLRSDLDLRCQANPEARGAESSCRPASALACVHGTHPPSPRFASRSRAPSRTRRCSGLRTPQSAFSPPIPPTAGVARG